jgi:hypothetical protein
VLVRAVTISALRAFLAQAASLALLARRLRSADAPVRVLARADQFNLQRQLRSLRDSRSSSLTSAPGPYSSPQITSLAHNYE